MRIALGTDHAGFAYKEAVKTALLAQGHEVLDCGCASAESCDYPDFVRPAAEAVADGRCDRAVVFGGSGNGEAICANKVRGVRCALAWSEATASLGRAHNDANVLAIGARQIERELCLRLVALFLDTPFDGGRHQRRIDKLE